MAENSIIKITDMQITDDGEDKIEITTKGCFQGDSDNYTLEFEEIFDEDIKSRTVMCVKDGKCVNILRRGDVNTELVIERGKRHSCHYITPYGDMMVGIFAKDVESDIYDGNGKIRLCYTVDFDGYLSATKEMSVEIGKIIQ